MVWHTYFKSFLILAATFSTCSGADFEYHWDFETTDWNRDGKPDLVAIKKNETDSKKTEVHIFAGPEFSKPLLHASTAIHETNDQWDFLIADWTLDGTPDLWAINRKSDNGVDVHIYSGEGQQPFRAPVVHEKTPLPPAGNNCEFMAIPPLGKLRRPSLLMVQRSQTGTSSTEVHILDGGKRFREFHMQQGTALHETGTGDDWTFGGGDFNGDGYFDLICATTKNGGELHVLDGKSKLADFCYHGKLSNLKRDVGEARSDMFWSCGAAFTSAAALLGASIGSGPAAPGVLLLKASPTLLTSTLCVTNVAAFIGKYREYQEHRASGAGRREGGGDFNDGRGGSDGSSRSGDGNADEVWEFPEIVITPSK